MAALIATLGVPWSASADEGADIEFVRGWIRAIRTDSKEAVTGAVSFPFTYREAWPKKQCERTARNPKGLADWLTCVRRKEKLLMNELKWERETLRLEAGNRQASEKLRALAKDLGAPGEWVSGHINGDGVTYKFLFVLRRTDAKRRVSALLIDAFVEEG